MFCFSLKDIIRLYSTFCKNILWNLGIDFVIETLGLTRFSFHMQAKGAGLEF